MAVARSSSDGAAICYVRTSGFLDDTIFSYHCPMARIEQDVMFIRRSPGGGTSWTSDNHSVNLVEFIKMRQRERSLLYIIDLLAVYSDGLSILSVLCI